jgi:MarR family transcriptional regulator, organic hydroperoxide resistance regulator
MDVDFQSAFWSAKRAVAEATEAAFHRHGVHAGQQFILRRLWEEDGLTPGQIARRLGLATPTVTKMTSRMEAAGLVRRGPDYTDRRLVRIYLTERGRDLQEVIGEEMHRVTERALGSLTEEERKQLVRLLDEVQRNLSGAAKAGLGAG